MRKQLQVSVIVAALLALGVSIASAQTREIVRDQITVRGTVEAVDHTGRTVTIRGQQGNVMTFDVPTSVVRFDQLKAGDIVTISYYDRINLRRKPAGEADVDSVADPTTTPSAGTTPGGTLATQRIKTVTITAWDPVTRTVTYTGPKGQSYSRHVAETLDPAVISGLKVGDRVDVIWTEALRLSVESAAVVQAPPPPDDLLRHRLTLSVMWGPDNQFSGKMITAGSGTLRGVPINLNETSFDDVYGRMGLFKVGVGYRTSKRSELVLNWVISRSSSEAVQVGTAGALNAPVAAKFDDYNYWGIEAGQRFYFARVRFTPYVGYTVGLNRFDAINANFAAPAVGGQPVLTVPDGQFYDSSWALSFAPTGGVLIGLGPIELLGEVALRYMGGLSDVDPLSEAGLKDVNAESSRWSFPIMLGTRIRF